MTRWIKFEMIENVRDLGGIKNDDGFIVKKGMLYRSARLSNMTQSDYNKLQKLNIGIVFDYRHYDEASKHPTPNLENIKVQNIPAMNSDFAVSETDFHRLLQTLDFDHFTASIIKSYKAMPFDNIAYSYLFDYIKMLPDHAILQHCTVGRDRTGVGCALTLLLLGVSRKEVINDYLLSNQGLFNLQKTVVEQVSPELTEIQKTRLQDTLEVKALFLDAALDSILSKYGSFSNYFEKEYGICEIEIKKIQKHYLEKTE